MLIDDIQGIGTHWWFELHNTTNTSEYYRNIICDEINKFEKSYSRFLPDSLVSQLNKQQILANPPTELIALLTICSQYYGLTNGSFNPALGEILENRGYDIEYSFEHKSKPETLVNFDDLVILNDSEIRLNGSGNIDLGGLGKGFLIDKLADIFCHELDLNSFLINGGGDIYVSSDYQKEVILEHPFTPGYTMGSIDLQGQSLGCSSNQKRNWKTKNTGETFGHIIDPWDINKYINLASFVVADTAVVADIVATVLCIIGDDTSKIQKLLQNITFEYAIVSPNNDLIISSGFPQICHSK